MAKAVHLRDHGIRVFACRLYNHDYLWFSGTEISKVSTTVPVLHNYALTYALGALSYGLFVGSTPRYAEDMARIPLYSTPALASEFSRTRVTYNAVNSLSLRTDDKPRDVNSPDIGWRNYIDLATGAGSGRDKHGFAFYLFTFDGSKPRGVIRIGKKGCSARIQWQELSDPVAVYREEAVQPSHPVNPLDIRGDVERYDLVNMPPHLILRSASIRRDWFVFSIGHRVHIPRSVAERCALPQDGGQ